MRIIAGRHRGRTLAAPPGEATRPTAERVRQALFDMLWHAPWGGRTTIQDRLVLDAFAGTGALGLEALSRGAAHCTFIEQDRDALDALRANIAKLGAAAEVRPQSVSTLAAVRLPFDLLLLDPPYASGGGGALIERLTRLGWAAPGAWASVETGREEAVSAGGWTLDAERVHGKAKLSLLRLGE